MNRDQLLHPPRQRRLEYASNQIGPRFSRTVKDEIQTLLAQLLVEVVRLESESTQGDEDERQDP